MPDTSISHLGNCSCNSCSADQPIASIGQNSRRDFFKSASAIAAGVVLPPSLANAVSGDAYHENELFKNNAVKKGKATVFTLLHTSDIHAQLHTHDEFFFENGKPIYKKRGGFAVLKTMLHNLKSKNPSNTIIIDGGDCFQGGGVAALTEGRGIVPLVNNIGYERNNAAPFC